jgi:hypothetical protein
MERVEFIYEVLKIEIESTLLTEHLESSAKAENPETTKAMRLTRAAEKPLN